VYSAQISRRFDARISAIGPIGVEKVDDEGISWLLVDAFVGDQVAHVEKIAPMLTVKRGD
jgi:hypothetical protein